MKDSKKIKILSLLLFLMFFLVPLISFAYNLGEPIVPKCTDCGWNDLMTLINNVITFILKYMAIPISAIMFAYAGFLLVTAGGEAAHARTKAKEIFMNTLIGLVLAIGSWLIISTILAILGWEGSWIGLHVDLKL